MAADKKIYDSSHSAQEIDRLLDGSLQHEDLTQAEYDRKKSQGTIKDGIWYCIFGDARKQLIQAIYVGTTLIAKSDNTGSKGFPYIFPIIF